LLFTGSQGFFAAFVVFPASSCASYPEFPTGMCRASDRPPR
jgi:hypothetical protein